MVEVESSLTKKLSWLEEASLYKCVHCGFCLQACPTYLATGLETESPRGRIALMKAVNEGRLGLSDQVIGHWDLCIQCRACEDVCPSGVPYGNLIESTMKNVREVRSTGLMARVISNIALRHVIPSPKMLSALFWVLRIYIKSGAQKIIRKTGFLGLISRKLRQLERMTPSVNGGPFRADGHVYTSGAANANKIQMLTGCVMSLAQGEQMRAAVRVLNRNGTDVEATKSQVCCGAINSHVGDIETARELARKNIDAFSCGIGQESIVTASAGCGARMKEYKNLLSDDLLYSEKAISFSSRVLDVNEYLSQITVELGALSKKRVVTYQDSCHLANVQKIRSAPRKLLESITGVDFCELEGANICCGAGGTYMLTEPDMSKRVLASKVAQIKESGADTVATANPGCFMQLENGIEEAGLDVEVMYVTDLLDESYSDKQKR